MNKFDGTKLPKNFSEENKMEEGRIGCWARDQGTFQLYIFSALFQDANTLEKLWEPLNDDIAVDFQATLTLNVESWNIYIIYLVKESVNRDLKYKIEQDKFSCRKLVFDNFGEKKWRYFLKHEMAVADFINDKLFKITIENQAPSDEENLDSILRKEHETLLQVINNNSEKINYKPVFDKFLNQYGKKD